MPLPNPSNGTDRWVRLVGAFIKDIGFPVAVAAYVLFRLDGRMDELTKAIRQLIVTLGGVYGVYVPPIP